MIQTTHKQRREKAVTDTYKEEKGEERERYESYHEVMHNRHTHAHHRSQQRTGQERRCRFRRRIRVRHHRGRGRSGLNSSGCVRENEIHIAQCDATEILKGFDTGKGKENFRELSFAVLLVVSLLSPEYSYFVLVKRIPFSRTNRSSNSRRCSATTSALSKMRQ